MPEIHLSQVLAEERRAIDPTGEARPMSALCISGGGIRSATFALGAIQGLAESGLLAQFDYLSTVSGGGYIGSWLSAWNSFIARPIRTRLPSSTLRDVKSMSASPAINGCNAIHRGSW